MVLALFAVADLITNINASDPFKPTYSFLGKVWCEWNSTQYLVYICYRYSSTFLGKLEIAEIIDD